MDTRTPGLGVPASSRENVGSRVPARHGLRGGRAAYERKTQKPYREAAALAAAEMRLERETVVRRRRV